MQKAYTEAGVGALKASLKSGEAEREGYHQLALRRLEEIDRFTSAKVWSRDPRSVVGPVDKRVTVRETKYVSKHHRKDDSNRCLLQINIHDLPEILVI